MSQAIEWLVGVLINQVDAKMAEQALVALLRAVDKALKAVAVKTPTKIDDLIVAANEQLVAQIAKALGVP